MIRNLIAALVVGFGLVLGSFGASAQAPAPATKAEEIATKVNTMMIEVVADLKAAEKKVVDHNVALAKAADAVKEAIDRQDRPEAEKLAFEALTHMDGLLLFAIQLKVSRKTLVLNVLSLLAVNKDTTPAAKQALHEFKDIMLGYDVMVEDGVKSLDRIADYLK